MDDVIDRDDLDGCDVDMAAHAVDDAVVELLPLFPHADPGGADPHPEEWHAVIAAFHGPDAQPVRPAMLRAALAAGYQLDLADRMRATGLPVVEIDGWRTRGSATLTPAGSVNHHTAGAATGNAPSLWICIHGRPDLAGPLCNVLMGRDCTLYIIAGGRANHAGEGMFAGVSGNSRFLGVEVENVGTDAEPPNLWQVAAMAKVHAELARGRWDHGRVCQHYEYATPAGRKRDFWHLNGDQFRWYVATALNPPPATDPAPTEEPEMPPAIAARYEDDGDVWCVGVSGRWHVPNQKVLDLLRFFGIVGDTVVVKPATMTRDEFLSVPICAPLLAAPMNVDDATVGRIAAAVVAMLPVGPGDVDVEAIAAAVVAGMAAALAG